ncbi:MAG TPA: hypothetical protein VKA67_11215 [Verrucomicrobiae bacterium]|nr:hypothetical protein [Verrucomicrobiae bacterium]
MTFRRFINFPLPLLICFYGTWILSAQTNTTGWFHPGPLFDRFQLTLSTGQRTEALGPLFYHETNEDETTWAIPPLISHNSHPEINASEWDMGYPLLTLNRYGTEYRWQFIQLFSLSGGNDQRDIEARRSTIFPFYFQQRSKDPALNYTAVVPFYGHLKNRLFRDEIFFVMFPFYGQTRKRDVVTYNYLYPFFHLRHGDGLHGWQFWPLIGNEHKDVTTRTNGFGDVEVVGGYNKFFALWPFYFDQKTGIGTTNPATIHASLPFFYWRRSPQRDVSSVITPFFNHIVERGKKYREWDAPWPVIEFARGEGKTTSRVWPFFSRAHNQTVADNFYLWPIYKYRRVHSDPLDLRRTRILFFLFSNRTEKNTGTGVTSRQVNCWPLFTYSRELNGNQRLQILALLEPFLPGNEHIRRDYSPLWSIWRSETNPRTSARSQSLLWNLYRRDVTPKTRKCSLLFGLFQYQSNQAGSELRLFYIPVMKTGPQAGRPAAH